VSIEIVRTDADQPWHVRVVASNGRTVAHSENYADVRDAETAVAVIAEQFGITMQRPPERDPETGALRGEAPDGNVYAYPVTRVDERDDPTPDDETWTPAPEPAPEPVLPDPGRGIES
jgi:uncharacterized protein YegP (UPF0339 family)